MRVLRWAAITLLLSACGGEPQPFRVGLIAPLSGDLAETGRATVDAAQLAAKRINDAGSLRIGGQPTRLVLRVEDNHDSAEASVGAVLKLVNQERVAAIIGPQASRNAIPAAGAANDLSIPLLSPASTHPDTTRNRPWVFRVAYTDDFQGRAIARFARRELGLQRAAVLFDIASAYNRNLAAVFRHEFEALGGQLVAFESYTRDAPRVTAQLGRIRDSGAQALFLPNYYNEVPGQVRQARELGLNPVWLGSDSWATIPADQLTALEGAYFSAVYSPDSGDEQVRAFVDAYRAAYGRDPVDVAALTYDAVGLLAAAAGAADSAGPAAIRNALAKLDGYQGVTGTIAYTDSGDPVKSAVVLQVHAGGTRLRTRIEPGDQ
ncbi:branched-chain amino acid ABC transporter substrate-binding protein [Marinobacterium nitratireducens]|uniref:Branched-chain amino acid ABC transporter substrate-binding protein n=1 Tax=Marinobacterium nitratireducens TaxID=518897 RepID=A0A917Z9K6_9GAMM|nr:ABC transporter substrate-binding protein [Marinobacterium nitratireducens]GGO76688.1 branched-chain amino acid ABC transporter substrate-binding protein [Marinobacterium nitratireducens]